MKLILDDGTVYGVLGVELLESYMDTKLPWDELQSDHHGSYLLASTTSDLVTDWEKLNRSFPPTTPTSSHRSPERPRGHRLRDRESLPRRCHHPLRQGP